mgnify:CR=1 FL=1
MEKVINHQENAFHTTRIVPKVFLRHYNKITNIGNSKVFPTVKTCKPKRPVCYFSNPSDGEYHEQEAKEIFNSKIENDIHSNDIENETFAM